MNDKYQLPAVVLAEFVPVEPASPIPQDDAREIMAFAIAKAKCVESGITSDAEANAILDKVKSRCAKYWIPTKYIKQRRLLLAVSHYSMDSFGSQLKVNGSFVKPDAYTPLFVDFIRKDTNQHGANLGERMALYRKIAGLCIKKIYKDIHDPPDDMIHVTTSGYLSPSPIEELVSQKEWLNTTVTHSYNMGCYGSLPAIRIAHGLISSSFAGVTPPKSQVDIVHTEIYSTHTDITNDSPTNLITMSLFGDGIIKYSAFSEAEASRRGLNGLKILALKECLIANSLDQMTMVPNTHKFHSTLSIKIPITIKNAIRPFVQSIFKEVKKEFNKEKDNIVYAIHPGGPAIIDHIASELRLTPQQVALSKEVLHENGNVSSATLPYMFNEIVNSDEIPVGTNVLAIGFGPGVTVSGAILEKT